MLAFQPHRYTRTHDLIDDFGKVLSSADVLLVTEVYAAGEAPIPGADGRAICRAVRSRGLVEPVFVDKVEELAESLKDVIRDGDVIVTMGAGNISAVAHALPERLAELLPRRPGRARVSVAVAQEFALRVRAGRADEPPYVLARRRTGGGVLQPARPRGSGRVLAKSLPPDVPIQWVGLGSNLLVRDGGLKGVVISTHGTLDRFDRLNQTRSTARRGSPVRASPGNV